MEISRKINKVKIAYFSGTGSTARVADALEREFTAYEISVIKLEIRAGNIVSGDKEDLLILLFAVHAFNAPKVVYKWIDSLSSNNNRPVHAAVISVSGGGEMTPNTACRVSSIRKLERKNCKVVYEKMVVMPSNWFVKTDDRLAIRLLEIRHQRLSVSLTTFWQGLYTEPGRSSWAAYSPGQGKWKKREQSSLGRKSG
ncbi:hypothetical protein [Methanosarcina sp.]|uniref:hypothetical protein n=1 Tax=Methanosarcina sp. TaxID=2213 RepID=UPI002AB884DC|nr:hypothetical protein [Methanosarcina sp.]MDY9925554.1 hypothetical protein [Methanosarcina sp.]